MATLYYQGHGSFRITALDGRVLYIDPYVGDGYHLPADLIFVTHQHGDHNQVQLCAKKSNCLIITNHEALKDGKHQSFSFDGINVEAVEACNNNHNPKECVGYIIEVDGIKIYASGDTSTTEQMKTLKEYNLDYALFPCDGVYNMDLDEAAECAELIGAKHNIPIHLKPGALFDLARAESWTAPNRLIVKAGEEINLN